MAKKISISDVAKRAKVSITTVSRVINNFPTVSPRNVSRVQEAISELNYKPNVSAQRLARGQNNTIGLVMPGYAGIFHSFYAIELMRGVGHACEVARMDLLFHITDGSRSLNTSALGGVVFADIIENRKQVESALDDGVSCMIINNVVKDLDVNYIAVDNYAGGAMVADYLIDLGHSNIATVTGNMQTQSGLDRFEGFKNQLEKNSVYLPEEYIFIGDYSRRTARLAAEHFLTLPNRPTAIFAQSDDMALEVIAVANEMGIKIPEEVSIMGFDDNPQSLYAPVGLTTVRQPIFEMAKEGVEALNKIVNNQSSELVQKTLPPEIVIRESCSPPGSSSL